MAVKMMVTQCHWSQTGPAWL